MKWIIEGTLDDVSKEDSGHAVIANMTDQEFVYMLDGHYVGSLDDDHLFVRIQSYHDPDSSEPIKHPIMDMIKNKRVRVTIELLDV